MAIKQAKLFSVPFSLLFFLSLISKAQVSSIQINKQPNIIFILSDDLGYGDLGCYGQQKIATPNLDKMAADGMRFTQFYAGTAVCAPSRCALLTGMHTGHGSVRGNKGMKPEGQFPMADSSITFVQLLQKQGYHTAAFGKWGLGYVTTEGAPSQKGFDIFYGYNCQTLAHNYYPDHLWENEIKVSLPGNVNGRTDYSADLIHQHALHFIKNQQPEKPFFAYLPYTLPHGDLTVPHDSLYNYYVALFNDKPLAPKEGKTVKEGNKPFEPYPHAAYAAMVSRLDNFVGEILSLLHNKGLEQNTLVLFSSDNGPHREDGNDPDYFNSNGGLKGIKRDLYEGGIREPMIAYWKGTIPAKTINNNVSAMWDLFPTFLSVAKTTKIPKTDGVSILPSLLKPSIQIKRRYLYWELHESGGKQAIRMGDWKAIKLQVSELQNSPIELYKLNEDRSESNNVASKFPAVVQQMEKLFTEAHQKNKNWPLLLLEKQSSQGN